MNMNIWTVSAYTCVGGLGGGGGGGDMNGLRISTAVSLDTDTVGSADLHLYHSHGCPVINTRGSLSVATELSNYVSIASVWRHPF